MRKGVEIIEDVPGTGPPVQRHIYYNVRLRMWLSRGDQVLWSKPWGLLGSAFIDEVQRTIKNISKFPDAAPVIRGQKETDCQVPILNDLFRSLG